MSKKAKIKALTVCHTNLTEQIAIAQSNAKWAINYSYTEWRTRDAFLDLAKELRRDAREIVKTITKLATDIN